MITIKQLGSLAALMSLLMIGCGGGSSGGSISSSSSSSSTSSSSSESSASSESSSSSSSSSESSASSSSSASSVSAELIKLNQVGYLPDGQKFAMVPDVAATTFSVVNDADETVFSADLSAASTWQPAADSVKAADFSSFTTPGQYRLVVEGVADSDVFTIGDDVYSNLHDATIKAYYFNRASTELLAEHAGEWARDEGHPDTSVRIHTSAASTERPVNTLISAPKGWYDAGDYNKYIVNSGISTYTLLAAYEHFPAFYENREWNIPESGGALPDLLDEVLWNLDWMVAMQDPNDGGVYHKLTTLNFSGAIMPEDANAQRYVVTKSTAAALNFAAVMATASRVFADIDATQAANYQTAAVAAWDWAEANPNETFSNPSGVNTGEYGDGNLSDEFAWAAAELFITTGENAYLTEFLDRNAGSGVPGWSYVAPLAYMSLVFHSEDRVSASQYSSFESKLIDTADGLAATYASSIYKVSMTDFYWGSNGVALNQAMMLTQAWRISGSENYRNAALGLVDYALGKNPTDYSYVTGYGARPPMDIHHRQSYSDMVDEPVPGFLAGGPNPGQQDNCDYPSDEPAKSYVDTWCSYASNEITINWNAPLVYVLAAIQAL